MDSFEFTGYITLHMERPPSSKKSETTPPRDSSWVRKAGLLAAMGTGALGIIKGGRDARADTPQTAASREHVPLENTPHQPSAETSTEHAPTSSPLYVESSLPSPVETPAMQGSRWGREAVEAFYNPELLRTSEGTAEEIATHLFDDVMAYIDSRTQPLGSTNIDAMGESMVSSSDSMLEHMAPHITELAQSSDPHDQDIAVALAERFGRSDLEHKFIPQLQREGNGLLIQEVPQIVINPLYAPPEDHSNEEDTADLSPDESSDTPSSP